MWPAVKAEDFPVEKGVTASSDPQDLYSPFYPASLSSQDYTWIIQAEKFAIVTVEVL